MSYENLKRMEAPGLLQSLAFGLMSRTMATLRCFAFILTFINLSPYAENGGAWSSLKSCLQCLKIEAPGIYQKHFAAINYHQQLKACHAFLNIQ